MANSYEIICHVIDKKKSLFDLTHLYQLLLCKTYLEYHQGNYALAKSTYLAARTMGIFLDGESIEQLYEQKLLKQYCEYIRNL